MWIPLLIFTLIYLTGSKGHTENLKVLIYGQKPELNLAKSQNMYDYVIAQCVHRTLVRLDESGVIRGDLAQSWIFQRNRKELIFNISQIPHLDSHKTPADLVAQSLRESIASSSDVAKILKEHVNQIEALNPTQIRIKLNKSFDPILKALSSVDMGILYNTDSHYHVGLGHYHLRHEKRDWLLLSDSGLRQMELHYASTEREVMNRMAQADLALGIPNAMALTMKKRSLGDLKLSFENNLTFTYYLVNPEREFSRSADRRQYLRQVLMTTLRDYHSEALSPLTNLLPDGVLPKLDIDFPKVTAQKWKGNLRVQFASEWWPADLKPRIANALRKVASQVTFIDSNSKLKFDPKTFDLIASDFVLVFDDPQLALPAFDLSPFGIVNPLSFRTLNAETQEASILSGKLRLKGFSKAFANYIQGGWAIPLFSSKIAIFRKPNVTIGETTYQFQNLLCPRRM